MANDMSLPTAMAAERPSTKVFRVVKNLACWCSLALVSLASPARATMAPYISDLHTTYLFHLDENGGGSLAANSGSAGYSAVAYAGAPFAGVGTNQPVSTSILGVTAFAGFAKAADLSAANDLGLGVDVSGDSAFMLDESAASPASEDRLPNHATVFGAGNGFTLEALIKLESITGFNREIIATDNGDSSSSDRGFQFRINTSGELQFNFVGVSSGSTVSEPIPTNGPHAFVTGEWFHVAMAYDGAGSMFYWTRLDDIFAEANALNGSPLIEGVDLNDAAILVIGNEGRAAVGGSTEGLTGLIDEVRISNVARASNEFVFRSVSVLAASTWQDPNVPDNILDDDLGTRWSAEGDGQWITLDLGRSEVLESIDIAFYLGDARTTTFDVLLSNDNTNWLTVLTNASSSGVTLSLESFDPPVDLTARYVQIVGHGNSQNDWNSLTEVVLHTSLPADTDDDGLPDAWENYYFMDLDESAAGDPDEDTLSNLYEHQHSLDPTQANGSGDLDNDGLPDSWEQMWFDDLDETPSGDPDRDTVNNLVEWQAGSDPTNPNSIPGDTDGDSLPDAWETSNLGTMTYWAYDDPDTDGYHNVAELAGGTSGIDSNSHPSWISPRVALLNDSVVTNTACLMPSGATYGRAINGVSFQSLPVLFKGYQYIAWYDTQGSDQSVWVGRRSVSGVTLGSWEMFDTGSNFSRGDENSWDAHNVIALGISHTDGTLHFSWDHHGHTLRYRQSVPGLCTTNMAAWGPSAFNIEQNWLVTSGQTISDVTYPRFFNSSSGEVWFAYRTGSTSAGDHWLHEYMPGTSVWTVGRKFSGKEGTFTGLSLNGGSFTASSRNAYENGYSFGSDGTLHYTWTYREATSNPSNHDIHYAYSTDEGVTWYNNAGALIADTDLGQLIRVDSPGVIVKVIDMRQRLINQQAQCVDEDGRVHVLMLHRRVEPGFEWQLGDSAFSTEDTAYYHYFRDLVSGVWAQRRLPVDIPVGSRPKIGFDATGNMYAAFVGGYSGGAVPGYSSGNLVIASASAESQYTDWAIVQVVDIAMDGEPLIDQARLLADNILSVFIQETGPSSGSAIGTPLHVIDFAVGVQEPDIASLSVSLNSRDEDILIVVASASGYSYQLRVATTLSPPDWTDVGPAVPGVDGLLALPDPTGADEAQRFYSVRREP